MTIISNSDHELIECTHNEMTRVTAKWKMCQIARAYDIVCCYDGSFVEYARQDFEMNSNDNRFSI